MSLDDDLAKVQRACLNDPADKGMKEKYLQLLKRSGITGDELTRRMQAIVPRKIQEQKKVLINELFRNNRTLGGVIAELQKLAKKYGSDRKFSFNQAYRGPELVINHYRPETLKEFKARQERKNRELAKKRRQVEQRRRELEEAEKALLQEEQKLFLS